MQIRVVFSMKRNAGIPKYNLLKQLPTVREDGNNLLLTFSNLQEAKLPELVTKECEIVRIELKDNLPFERIDELLPNGYWREPYSKDSHHCGMEVSRDRSAEGKIKITINNATHLGVVIACYQEFIAGKFRPKKSAQKA